MEGIYYPISLLVLAVMAFSFNQTNNSKIALLMVLIGIYIVYSHETGNTVTEWKNDMVKSIDDSAGNFSEERGTGGYNETKSAELIEKNR